MGTDGRPPFRGDYRAQVTAWPRRYLAPLVGRTITAVDVTDEGFPVLRLDNGAQVLVSCDEEGNGPGALLGLPRPG